MTTSIFIPCKALQTLVESIVVVHIDFTSLNSPLPIYKFMPTSTRFMCFQLQDTLKLKKEKDVFEQRSASLLIGPHLKPVVCDFGRQNINVIIQFTPSGMFRLLGFSLQEMLQLEVDSRSILGNDVDQILERLSEAKTDDHINKIVQRYLLKKVQSIKALQPVDRAIDKLVQSGGRLSMDNVASISCLSIRQFQRLSVQRLGISPKLYARLIRFSNAYKYKQLYPYASWLEISYRFGYFDQMHFIRDFKYFSNEVPSMVTEEGIKASVKIHTLLT